MIWSFENCFLYFYRYNYVNEASQIFNIFDGFADIKIDLLGFLCLKKNVVNKKFQCGAKSFDYVKSGAHLFF